MTNDLVKQALAELQDLVRCRCDKAYKDRKLHDPDCHCDDADNMKIVADYVEELERILSSSPCEIAAHSNRLTEYMFHWEGRALDAEAKLAKAVEALRRIANSQPRPMRSGGYEGHDVSNMQRTARATLAEIDGDKP